MGMNDPYLAHHGIKGQKWGVRRFQNEDGSYTSAGKARAKSNGKKSRKLNKDLIKASVIGLTGVALTAGALYATDTADFDQQLASINKSNISECTDRMKELSDAYNQAAKDIDDDRIPLSEASALSNKASSNSIRAGLDAKLIGNQMDAIERRKPRILSKKRKEALDQARKSVSEMQSAADDLKESSSRLNSAVWNARARAYRQSWDNATGSTDGGKRTYGNSSNSTDGDRRSTRYGRKSTAQTKSKDRVADMKSRGVKVGTVEEESKRVRDLSSRIQQAQREGKDTTQMVQDLQDARARKKIAVERESMQHGFVCMCRRSRAIL